MYIIIPILVLVLTPLVMLGLYLRRPGFSYFWLLALLGSLLAWPLILLARSQAPLVIPLLTWQPKDIFPISPALLVDEISWPFALALVTLNLATVLTAVSRIASSDQPRSNLVELASYMLITAASVLGVLAGNLLTLLFSWAVLDFIELILWLLQARNSARSPQVVIAFAGRAAGYVPFVWAWMIAYASGLPLSFTNITTQISFFLLIAAGLRLGILPVNNLLPDNLSLQRGMRTMLRLAPQAANLVLASRAATGASSFAAIGAFSALTPVLMILISLVALYGSLCWISADDEIDGLPFWVLCAGSLALAAAVSGQPAASLAWGIALLLPGGLLFLFSTRYRWLLAVLLIGAFSLSGLPFSPTWQGVHLYAPPLKVSTLILLLAHGVLLAGYLRHAIRPVPPLPGAERWVWFIYPLGLLLLPLAHFAIAWWSRPISTTAAQIAASGLASWIGGISILLAIPLLLWSITGRRIPDRVIAILRAALAVEWLYHLLGSLYRIMNRLFSLTNTILEGQGGILWALLILTLLLSLFVQTGLGG